MSSRVDPPTADEVIATTVAPPSEEALPLRNSAEHAELQRQGAKAAVRGDASGSNPMLVPINKPDATGESKHVWSGRRDAWERGHSSQQPVGFTATRRPGGIAANERDHDEALYGVTRVRTFAGRDSLTSASGFFFERDDRLFLVTSRHVLFDGPTCHTPDRIEIDFHTDAHDLTQLGTLSILLHRDGLAVWRQAKDIGGEVDVAVLELDPAAIPAGSIVRAFGPEHLALGFDLFEVGDLLAVPGFPLGFFDTVHHLPVVRQASIASSYGVRFQGLGHFLTDARMHRGCSGSPVLARIGATTGGRRRWCLLGIHSSRVDMTTRDAAQDESLGLNCVWYADVLMALTADATSENS